MTKARRAVLALILCLPAVTADTAGGAVLCKKKKGAVFVRDACKRSETPLDLAALGVVGPTGPTGPIGDKGDAGTPGAPATRLFAHVDNNGNLDFGVGVTAAIRASEGTFRVTFDRDLHNCAIVATIGFATGYGGAATGFDVTARSDLAPNANRVTVLTYDGNNMPGDSAFHLVVFC